MTLDERHALTLYVVANRDLCDFADMIQDHMEASDTTLAFLQKMLNEPGTERTDRGLNRLCLSLVDAEIKRRVEKP